MKKKVKHFSNSSKYKIIKSS